MALVTTMSGVIGVLAAMALFLWFSAYIEARHLGPVAGSAAAPTTVEADLTEESVHATGDATPLAVPLAADPLTSAA